MKLFKELRIQLTPNSLLIQLILKKSNKIYPVNQVSINENGANTPVLMIVDNNNVYLSLSVFSSLFCFLNTSLVYVTKLQSQWTLSIGAPITFSHLNQKPSICSVRRNSIGNMSHSVNEVIFMTQI